VRPDRPQIPDDQALPQIERLLDADAVAPVLERMLGRETGIASVRVAYVRYRRRSGCSWSTSFGAETRR